MRWLLLLVAPAVGWLLYHRTKDRLRPEPVPALLWTYAGGVAAGFACLRAYDLLDRAGLRFEPDDGAVRFLAYCLIGVGLVEELFKFAAFALFAMRSRHFDEPIDGIVYASVAGLGFASFENYHYMAFLDGGAMAARAVASPLTHAMFASIWGHAAGRRVRGAAVVRPVTVALGIAAVAHGTYDFVAVGLPPAFRPATAGIILALWIWRMRTIRALHDEHRAGARN